jgi:hypothetical protein
MAESGSWASIRKNGLLSTTALLDNFKITGKRRHHLESEQRKESVVLGDLPCGPATIRDQIVLNESALRKNLDGMTTGEYYKLLNGKTFFWAQRERLERLLKGRQYKNRFHDVITVDTKSMVEKHRADLWLSRINSGAFFGSGRRGIGTFRTVEDYPFEEIRRKQKEDAVVEVAIDYAVKDIAQMTLRVECWKGEKIVGMIWTANPNNE